MSGLGNARPLTERQRAFCRAVVAGKSGTEAAIAAGYAAGSADVTAARLRANPAVADEIARLRQDVEDAAILTGAQLQRWWSDVIRSDDEATKDKLRASQLLGEARGLFTKRVELTLDDLRALPDEVLDEIIGEAGE